ncbi:MAG: BACON domain-containing carbohydrate-binding protein [Bacteroidota bacterium]
MKDQLTLNESGHPVKNLMLSFVLVFITGAGLLAALPAGVNGDNFRSSPDDPKCTAAPAVTTLPATAITPISAVLNGTVNPNQGYTSYYFSWGTTTVYDYTTAVKYAGAGNCIVTVTATITGLIPGMTYHFQLVAYNAVGTTYGNDEVFIAGEPQPPVLSVTPANRDVMSSAGTTTFSVESNAVWTAVSDQPWCSVTPSGAGNGTITAGYAVNNTQEQRQANITVTVEGLDPVVVTVTQAAPFITVTPQNQDVSNQSGSVVFNVNSNTSWTVTDNQPWCTVTTSGTGSGIIIAVFSENNTTEPRVAEITVNAPGLPSLNVTVTQESGGPYLIVTPSERNVTPDAGSTSYTVTSNTSWSATSDQSWCTVTPNGTGNGSVVASYSENTSEMVRTASITVSGEGVPMIVVILRQAGVQTSEFMILLNNIVQISPNEFEFDIFIQDTRPVEVLEMATCQFGIYFNQVILNGGGITSGMVTVFPWSDGFSDLPVTMAPIAVSTTAAGLIRIAGRAAPGCGGGFIISKVYPGTRIDRFRFTNSVPFTSYSTPDLVFTSSNAITPSYATRFAIYDQVTCLNTQLPIYPGTNAVVENNPVLNGLPVLEITPGDQLVEPVAGNVDFMVNSNTAWVAQTDVPWLTITSSGYGNGNIEAIFAGNTTGEPRSAAITVMAGGDQEIVILNQEGNDTRTLNLSLLIEGLYTGNGTMKQAFDAIGPHFSPGIADHVNVELHNSSDYTIVEHVVTGIELSTAGNVSLNIPPDFGGSYYITIKHRNSIETTTSIPVSFDTPVVSYAFDLPSKAYGNNLVLMIDGHYAILSGDVNQDGFVDTGDMTPVDNDSGNFETGYLNSDVNGDGNVDTGDMTIVDNNSAAYVSRETP